jgi:hypothetical protein
MMSNLEKGEAKGIGSNMAAKLGIPRGRVSVVEPALGMCTRRTGGAW